MVNKPSIYLLIRLYIYKDYVARNGKSIVKNNWKEMNLLYLSTFLC
jgi:hypothetical protein